VLEAIIKLKLKNSKNHFSVLVVYLPAYSYAGIVKQHSKQPVKEVAMYST